MAEHLSERISPKEWRQMEDYSLAQVAVLVGLRGKGARVIYHRYERGETSAPLEIIARLEKLSDCKVTYRSWLMVRREWLAAHPRQEQAVA